HPVDSRRGQVYWSFGNISNRRDGTLPACGPFHAEYARTRRRGAGSLEYTFRTRGSRAPDADWYYCARQYLSSPSRRRKDGSAGRHHLRWTAPVRHWRGLATQRARSLWHPLLHDARTARETR